MKKKTDTPIDGNLVQVDARIVAAAAAENPPEAIELRKELINEPGVAELAPGLEFAHDPALDYVEVRVGGTKIRVQKVDLWQFVFSTCTAQVRDQIMPVRQTEVMHYDKIHTVQLKKDMRAGSIMKVTCHMSVPTTVVEGLKGIVEKETHSGIII